MALLPSTSFAAAVASSKEQFKIISNIVSKYCGKVKSVSFMNACNDLDFDTANNILDDTVTKLTGENNVYMALSLYAEKFPRLPSLADKLSNALSLQDKVKVIDSYRDDIIGIIESKK